LFSMKEIAKYSGCFVCGDKNECGLRARFYFTEDKAVTECVAARQFEGYHDIYHGGITATLLDEVMIKALLAKDIFAMTVELTVKYYKPVKINQKLKFEGWLEKHKSRLYITSGAAYDENGDKVATAAGKYIEAKGDTRDSLLGSLEL
jgi:acyl-coenzyme A thioesterase PaaI-like protein